MYKREEIENGFAVPPPMDENPEKQKGSDESTETSDGMAGEMFWRNEDFAHEDGDETLLEHILAQTAKFLKCNNKYWSFVVFHLLIHLLETVNMIHHCQILEIIF